MCEIVISHFFTCSFHCPCSLARCHIFASSKENSETPTKPMTFSVKSRYSRSFILSPVNTSNLPHISVSFSCSFPNGHFPLFAFCYCLFRIASLCRYFLLTLHFSSFFNIFYFTIILITFYFTFKFFVLYYFILLPFNFFQ